MHSPPINSALRTTPAHPSSPLPSPAHMHTTHTHTYTHLLSLPASAPRSCSHPLCLHLGTPLPALTSGMHISGSRGQFLPWGPALTCAVQLSITTAIGRVASLQLYGAALTWASRLPWMSSSSCRTCSTNASPSSGTPICLPSFPTWSRRAVTQVPASTSRGPTCT